jgi:hypothetical protein
MPGTGNIKFERNATMAHIYVAEVMAMQAGQPIEVGKRYVIGRLVLYGRGKDLTGCAQPVCITWRRGEFVWGPSRDIFYEFGPESIVRRGGSGVACKLGGVEWKPAPPPSEAPAALPDTLPWKKHRH